MYLADTQAESPHDTHSFVEMSGSVRESQPSPVASKHVSTAVSMVSALTSASASDLVGSPRPDRYEFADEIESVELNTVVELPDGGYAQRHWW